MAKKHKKIFKQRIKEMLSQMERAPIQPTPPSIKPEIETPIPKEEPEIPKPEPKIISQSLTPILIVKSDLKKIALLLSAMFLVIITASIIASKTNWFFILADKLYNWAQLGS